MDKTLPKFILVGLCNTVLGAMIMFTLYNLAGWNYWASSGANYFLVSIMSFFLNKHFTFGNTKKASRQALPFACCILISYFFAYFVAAVGVKLLLSSLESALVDNIALAFGLCLFTACNYIGQRFLVFK